MCAGKGAPEVAQRPEQDAPGALRSLYTPGASGSERCMTHQNGDTRQHSDERPCRECGSTNHGTGAHHRLENACKRWGLGLTSSAVQSELDLAGVPGAPSPSDHVLVRPDLLRIVPFTISRLGRDPSRRAAILRLWKQDPEGGCTFMLSWDPSEEWEASSLARLFGGPGSIVLVDAGSTPSIRIAALRGT